MTRFILSTFIALIAWGLAGTAAAEHGSIDPFTPKTIRIVEHGSLDPFEPGSK